MKITHTIIILLVIAIALLLTDLFTGIWYWNQLNLNFDSANFNNIVTPIFTIIATIIYGFALFLTINQNKIVLNQNKIILSQNIKPYYEKEIENLITKATEMKIDGEISIENASSNINALNYINAIQSSIVNLSQNEEYLEDCEKYERNELLTKEHFENRNYYGKILFLSRFTLGLNSVTFFYQDIKLLIQEINTANLISEDKIILKKQIKRNLLSQYMAFVDFMDKHSSLVPPIPIIFNLPEKIEFQLLSKTNFREHYDWFKIELSETEIKIEERK